MGTPTPTTPVRPTAPLQVVETNGIRRFTDSNIQRAIESTLATSAMAKGRKVVSVAHADLEGASLTAVVKLGDKWSIMAGCYKPYKGKLKAEADVVWSPF